MKEASPSEPTTPNGRLVGDLMVPWSDEERAQETAMLKDSAAVVCTQVLTVSRKRLNSFTEPEAEFQRRAESQQPRHRIPYSNIDRIPGNIFLGSNAEFLDNRGNYIHIITVTDITRQGGPNYRRTRFC